MISQEHAFFGDFLSRQFVTMTMRELLQHWQVCALFDSTCCFGLAPSAHHVQLLLTEAAGFVPLPCPHEHRQCLDEVVVLTKECQCHVVQCRHQLYVSTIFCFELDWHVDEMLPAG